MAHSIPGLLQALAQAAPRAPALVAQDRVLCRHDLQRLIAAAALRLRDAGVQAGDVVGLALEGGPLHLCTLYAIAALRACAVSLPRALAPAVRQELAARYGIRHIVCSQPQAVAGLQDIVLESLDLKPGEAPQLPEPLPSPDDPFCILLTSGTTGTPKGTLNTHAMLLARAAHGMPDCGPATRLLPPGLHLSVGYLYPAHVLCLGGVLVFANSERWSDLLAAARNHRVTHLYQSPASAEELVRACPPGDLALPALEHLRFVGGTPSARVIAALRERVTPHVFVTYGMTEIGLVSLATPEMLARSPRSAGKLCPGSSAMAVDETGAPLPAGTTGELRVRVAGMPAGYFPPDPPGTGRFRDGHFFTGDLGRVSEDGEITIEGRVDDQINLGGQKLAPTWAEEILLQHPGLREAAVFARARGDETPLLAAAIVTADGGVPADLRQFCARELGHLAPRQFFVLDALPRTGSGKIMRAELARRITQLAPSPA